MFELNCADVIPGCDRVIRADSRAEVLRRAVVQAKQLGVSTISVNLLEAFRNKTVETRH